MHSIGVTHRDVKPDNVIFVDRTKSTIKLVDFGFAANHKERGRLRTVCGSPAYMAREIVSGKPYLGPPVDVWALGNFVYELLHSKPAFRAESITQLNNRIRRANFAHFNPGITKRAHNFVKRSLTVDVNERPTAATLTRVLVEGYKLKKTEAMEALMEVMEDEEITARYG